MFSVEVACISLLLLHRCKSLDTTHCLDKFGFFIPYHFCRFLCVILVDLHLILKLVLNIFLDSLPLFLLLIPQKLFVLHVRLSSFDISFLSRQDFFLLLLVDIVNIILAAIFWLDMRTSLNLFLVVLHSGSFILILGNGSPFVKDAVFVLGIVPFVCLQVKGLDSSSFFMGRVFDAISPDFESIKLWKWSVRAFIWDYLPVQSLE